MWALSRTRAGFFPESSASCAGVTASGPYVPTAVAPASFADQVVNTWLTTAGLFPPGQEPSTSFDSFAYSVSNEADHFVAASSVPNSLPRRATSALTLSASLSRFTSTSSAFEPAASLIFAA